MGGQVRGRFFLVGAARSGTTLLQAMVAAHPRVFSFPESHFFCHVVARGRRRWLGLAQPREAPWALAELLKLLQRPDLAPLAGRPWPRVASYARAFTRVLDRVALEQGKDVWLEKTPHHIDYVAVIARTVPGARFLHILRDGRDVVASQCDAMQQDPAFWGMRTAEELADLWNQDVQRSLGCLGRRGHLLVSYEALLEHPEAELRRVCDFMGLRYQAQMLEHWRTADTVVGWRRRHPWMRTAYEPLQDTRLRKYRTLFDEQQRASLERRLRWGGQVRPVLEAAGATAASAAGARAG